MCYWWKEVYKYIFILTDENITINLHILKLKTLKLYTLKLIHYNVSLLLQLNFCCFSNKKLQ